MYYYDIIIMYLLRAGLPGRSAVFIIIIITIIMIIIIIVIIILLMNPQRRIRARLCDYYPGDTY